MWKSLVKEVLELLLCLQLDQVQPEDLDIFCCYIMYLMKDNLVDHLLCQ